MGEGVPEDEDRSEGAARAAVCANCETRLHGEYCLACGQRRFPGRLTLRRLVVDLSRRVLNVERGFVATLLAMTVRPGRVIGDYIQGRQRRYVNPIAYLLLTGALALLTYGLFRQDVVAADLRAASLEQARVLSLNEAEAELYVETQLRLMRQVNVGGLLSCLPFAVLLRLFCWRGPLNLAEAGVFTLYVTGQLYLLGALADLLLPWWGLGNQLWLTVGLLVIVASHAAWGFFERRFSGVLRTVAAALLAYLGLGTVMTVVLLMYVKAAA